MILEVCGLDPATEPVPLVGRSPRLRRGQPGGYLGDLLRRAARRAGGVQTVVERVVAELPEPRRGRGARGLSVRSRRRR